ALYVMFLDADDLVHRDVVRHTLAGEHGSYLVNDAYTFDLSRRLLQRRPEGFDWARGSCFVCRFTIDELPTSADETTSAFAQFGASPDQRGHLEYPELATELGRAPVPFPFAAAVYTVNHPESTWGRRTDALQAGAYFRVGAGLGVPPSRDPPIPSTESEPGRGPDRLQLARQHPYTHRPSADEYVTHLFPSTLSAAAGKACPRPLRRPPSHKPRERPVLRRVGQTAPTPAEEHR